MRRRLSILVLLLAGVAGLVASCGSSPAAPGGGFALAGDLLYQDPPPPPPEPDWTVEVATAKPEIPAVAAFRDAPPEVGETDPPPDPETLPGAQLSSIPGEIVNVSSSPILGGWQFNNPTYFGNPLVFLVTENRGDWLKVMVPTRPNQQEGWIKASDVTLSTHEWHAEINVTTNTLRVWNGNDLVADTGTIDGTPNTPTPLGRFYFNEKLERSPGSAYGSWIISTSGYSDSLELFDDGLPVFAVHGTNNPANIGSDISNGCVRVPNEVIELLAAQMPMGTPLDVVT